MTPEELRTWDDAGNELRFAILRREVDYLTLCVSALIWCMTGGVILFCSFAFVLFWFVRKP